MVRLLLGFLGGLQRNVPIPTKVKQFKILYLHGLEMTIIMNGHGPKTTLALCELQLYFQVWFNFKKLFHELSVRWTGSVVEYHLPSNISHSNDTSFLCWKVIHDHMKELVMACETFTITKVAIFEELLLFNYK